MTVDLARTAEAAAEDRRKVSRSCTEVAAGTESNMTSLRWDPGCAPVSWLSDPDFRC